MSSERAHPGIRLVRPLSRDTHRESWLVQLDAIDDDTARPAVLVRAFDEHGVRRVRTELVALHRGRGAGLAPLLDVVDEHHGVGLLRAHVAGSSLGTVLAERERWAAGEIVTVLRPIVDALARLHRAGVAHGQLSAASFVVADGGAVLVELAHAELFAPEAPEAVLSRTGGVAADREAVRTLAGELLRRAEGSRARAAHTLADDADQRAGAELLDLLRAGLDDLASPLPLHTLAADPAPSAVTGAERMLPIVRDAADAAGPDLEQSPALLRSLPARLWARGSDLVGALRARFDTLPALRRRVLVAGGAALCAAAVLLALPGGGEPHGAPVHAHAPDSPESSAAPAAVPAQQLSGVASASIQGDDPLAAGIALLERRRQCFTELSLLCLEEVNQPGSAALSADRAAVAVLRSGDEVAYLDVEAIEPVLVERLGAGALVEFGPHTHPASLLLMRSEAGWRIRDWVAGSEN